MKHQPGEAQRCLRPDENDTACTCCQHRWFREEQRAREQRSETACHHEDYDAQIDRCRQCGADLEFDPAHGMVRLRPETLALAAIQVARENLDKAAERIGAMQRGESALPDGRMQLAVRRIVKAAISYIDETSSCVFCECGHVPSDEPQDHDDGCPLRGFELTKDCDELLAFVGASPIGEDDDALPPPCASAPKDEPTAVTMDRGGDPRSPGDGSSRGDERPPRELQGGAGRKGEP